MKFTPAQAIAIADLTQETLRYWKRHLPPIAGKRGHSPCYTRAEVLSLIVVRRLVRDFKMDVSVLGPQSERLFKLCSDAQWAQPNRKLLIVTATGDVTAHERLTDHEFVQPGVVFPIDSALQELNQRLNDQERPPQLELNLPPMVLGKIAGGVR